MAWFGEKISLGGFSDLAGAVNKISEGVKIIEKNFDSALGFEESRILLAKEMPQKHQDEPILRTEFSTKSVISTEETEELAEAHTSIEAQIELEDRLREAGKREKILLEKLEELRKMYIQLDVNRPETMEEDSAETVMLRLEMPCHLVELPSQPESSPKALAVSEEADFLAGTHHNTGASTELGNNLREAEEREAKLVQSLEELRQALNTKEEKDAFKEDMFVRDMDGLQRRYEASEGRCEELSKQVSELLRQIETMQRRVNEEVEGLREEYHNKVVNLERKVYALTKERDALRREQNKKNDAAALLKEKDEIISQVMAEGEGLSKKQAAQESHIRKLRTQFKECEEEKKGLLSKLQDEESKIEAMKKDIAEMGKMLLEMTEKHQDELGSQNDFFTKALAAANEAEALAEARASSEARTEIENRLRGAEEREAMLVQALEELRQTLSRKEKQAVFKEDMLCRDIEDLQQRYEASERRCEDLVAQVPESTRPFLRQIEAMQGTSARRAEAWAAVEKSLSSRLQEAEIKAEIAEERERSVNERLSQNLSRIDVLEAQISCLRAEQSQLSRSLEKERQRASEIRQEFLVAQEQADTFEGRAGQLKQEFDESRKRHADELRNSLSCLELLKQELETEKSSRADLERVVRHNQAADEIQPVKHASENGNLGSGRVWSGEEGGGHYHSHGVMTTPSSLEAALRQKVGELASYTSRLESVESVRHSLAEDLVKITAQNEKLQSEVSVLPAVRAELEALRHRHSSALELMGERDEQLEELRADMVDLKEMYKEQVELLVNKIEKSHCQ